MSSRSGPNDVDALNENELELAQAFRAKQGKWPFWRQIRILCTIWFFAVSVPCWIIALALSILLSPTILFDPRRRLITYICEMAMYIPCMLMPLWRFKNFGGVPEKFPDRTLIVCNHSSFLDICTVLSVLPFHVRFISMKAVGKVPIVGQLMQFRRDIFVDFAELKSATDGFRCTNRHSVLDESKQAVRNGDLPLIFPEGSPTKLTVTHPLTTRSLPRHKSLPYVSNSLIL